MKDLDCCTEQLKPSLPFQSWSASGSRTLLVIFPASRLDPTKISATDSISMAGRCSTLGEIHLYFHVPFYVSSHFESTVSTCLSTGSKSCWGESSIHTLMKSCTSFTEKKGFIWKCFAPFHKRQKTWKGSWNHIFLKIISSPPLFFFCTFAFL